MLAYQLTGRMDVMTNTITQMDASRIAELIAKRELSPVEAVQAHLDRIAEVNPKVNAIVTLAGGALEAAKKAERDIDAASKRALDDIRKEVADLTVEATERVTRKTLTGDDQRRLVEEALSELDFSALGERR